MGHFDFTKGRFDEINEVVSYQAYIQQFHISKATMFLFHGLEKEIPILLIEIYFYDENFAELSNLQKNVYRFSLKCDPRY